MAKKISELDPILGADSATGDLFVLVDVSGNVTGHMTRAELIEALGPNFTDITASGGIFLGGSAAVNYLDDYEEGIWTPILSDAEVGGNTASIGSLGGYYTKVGNLVTISCFASDIDITGMTAGNPLFIQGLPLANTSTATHQVSVGAVRTDDFTYTGAMMTVEVNVTNSVAASMKNSISNAPDTQVLVSQINSAGSDLFFTLTYKTDA